MEPNTTEILDVLEDEKEDGTSIDDIYSFLLENEDIILVINADEEEALRRGLSLVKNRHQKKVQEQGLPPNGESKQLAFRVIERLADTDPQQIRIQIWLKKRSNVKVHQMIVSDKDL